MSLSPLQEKRFLWVLAGIQFSHIVDFMVMMPLGPQIMEAFGISAAAFGLLVSSYTYTGAISGLITASVIDRFDRRRYLLVVFSGFILASMACGLAQSYFWLVAARATAGAFGGIMGALIFTISADHIPYVRRGKASGVIMSAFSLSTVIGVPLSLTLATHWGWRMPFFAIGAVSLGLLYLAWREIPRKSRAHGHGPAAGVAAAHGAHDAHTASGAAGDSRGATVHHAAPPLEPALILRRLGPLRDVLRARHCQIAMGLSMLVLFSSFLLIPYITVHLVYDVGVRLEQIPLMYLFGGAASFFSARIIGRLADRYGKLKVYRRVALLSLIPLVWLPNMGASPLWLALICTTLFFVLVPGRMVAVSAAIVSAPPPSQRARFMAVNTAAQQLAMGSAAIIGGLLLTARPEGGFDGMVWVSLASLLATLLGIWWSHRVVLLGKDQAEHAVAS
ncbi:MAG: MFS transporter [Betaproteobacteria bacterium]|nr:MFS transporter [Betaproteobacteria bacterium]